MDHEWPNCQEQEASGMEQMEAPFSPLSQQCRKVGKERLLRSPNFICGGS